MLLFLPFLLLLQLHGFNTQHAHTHTTHTTHTTHRSLEALLSGACTRLTALGLEYNHRLPPEALAALAHVPGLAHLSLAACTAIDDAGLALVAAHCRQLKTLDLSSLSKITTAGLIPVLQQNSCAATRHTHPHTARTRTHTHTRHTTHDTRHTTHDTHTTYTTNGELRTGRRW
jgi:hypothetical protein